MFWEIFGIGTHSVLKLLVLKTSPGVAVCAQLGAFRYVIVSRLVDVRRHRERVN